MTDVDLLALEPDPKSGMGASRFISHSPSAGRVLVVIAYRDLDGDLYGINAWPAPGADLALHQKGDTLAKKIDPALAEQFRRKSEQTKDSPYPAGATGRRPNRQRVYSVRLSAEEEAEIARVTAAKHLPRPHWSGPGSWNDLTRNARPDLHPCDDSRVRTIVRRVLAQRPGRWPQGHGRMDDRRSDVITNDVQYRTTKSHLTRFDQAATNLARQLDRDPDSPLTRLELDTVRSQADDLREEIAEQQSQRYESTLYRNATSPACATSPTPQPDHHRTRGTQRSRRRLACEALGRDIGGGCSALLAG
jgi:hypothetical protein